MKIFYFDNYYNRFSIQQLSKFELPRYYNIDKTTCGIMFGVTKIIMILVTLILILYCSKARIIHHTVSISDLRRQKGWYYLDRMKFDKGYGKIQIRAKLNSEQAKPEKGYFVVVAVIPQMFWEDEKIPKCQRPTFFHNASVGDANFWSIFEKTAYHIPLKFINKALQDTQGIQFATQNLGYHYVLKECKKALINEIFQKDANIDIQVHVISNQNEYGDQQSPFLFWYPLFVIGNILMLKISFKTRDSIDNQIDWAKLSLHIGLWFNLGAILMKSLSFFIYIYVTGYEYGVFDYFYLTFHSISQSVVTGLLIFVAFGWTVTFVNVKDLDLYVPLTAIFGIINIILTLLNKINDQSHDKYHMYDSIPAYILIFFRILAFIIFIIGLGIVFHKHGKKPAVMKFYITFAALGLIYFLSLPILMVISTLLTVSSRQTFVFLTVEFIKNIVNLVLTFQLTSKKGGYLGIKYKNASFMQENGKLL